MPLLIIPHILPERTPYSIKVRREFDSWVNKQLGIVATQKHRSRTVVCLVDLPNYDKTKARIAR